MNTDHTEVERAEDVGAIKCAVCGQGIRTSAELVIVKAGPAHVACAQPHGRTVT